MPTSFRVDEGYSEETRSQPGSESNSVAPSRPGGIASQPSDLGLPQWILALGDADRHELAYAILRTLRTSSIATIVERLHPLLHLDPISYLPTELAFHIFSSLDPESLLVASRISQAWRERALDSRLWKLLYNGEGWKAEPREIRQFENELQQSAVAESAAARKARMARSAVDVDMTQKTTKKRIQESGRADGLRDPDQPSSQAATMNDGVFRWNPQHGPIEADHWSFPEVPPTSSKGTEDEEMRDADMPTLAPPKASIFGTSDSFHTPRLETHDSTSTTEDDPQSPPSKGKAKDLNDSPRRNHGLDPISNSLAKSTLTLPSSGWGRKLSWHNLYKQRKRLEDNWSAGRFVNFQLPHPDFQSEGHQECIYTIQYSGKYLVSGSRDKTLRIWNLDTRRLVGKPLVGHEGSVLCLQFDASAENDLIVSGSSDTDVIIWRFSTGEKIKTLKRAHKESVLNLRFDKRYLITCSKDKTINVWNRPELPVVERTPNGSNHRGSGPKYVFDMTAQQFLTAEARLANANKVKMLPPWSNLVTLRGHNAAVNAIQVYHDQIVSASGDRTIKVWNLRTGMCLMTIPGHNKGIACVQFDGRRIVSGSSDNSVKIFDRSTGAEVACLLGHQFLVRTVQAGFGDLAGSEEDDRTEAKEIDHNFFKARHTGVVKEQTGPKLRQSRNAGSKDPRNITAFGAALPPGGGGSRWGRIVSGSYDETVIIWKRDQEGNPTFGPAVTPPETPFQAVQLQAQAAQAQAIQMQQQILHGPGHGQQGSQVPNQLLLQQFNHLQQAHQQLEHQLSSQAQNQFTQMSINHQSPNAPANAVPPAQAANQGPAQHNVPQHGNAFAEAIANGQVLTPPAQQPNEHNPNNHDAPHQQQQQQPPQPLPQQHQHQHHQHHHQQQNGGNARVFKLQFDARRIICCSQDPRIVGWDFANNDEEIIEASRFFAGLE
ncbi:MAG: hypothetical protein M1837_004393 [Sclerophora amabilis]|nr:MAG: hypothetical protein M1837_004393 [Sclerophora amabilis]